MQSGDTILVAVGVYAENIQVPEVSAFTLLGDVVPDTGDLVRPIIDPSMISGSDSLACLTIPSGLVATIKDFAFRNGLAMFPRRRPSDIGGIWNRADSVSITRCVFDSTYRGLEPNPGWLVVEQSEFRDNPNICIRNTFPQSRMILRDSYLSGGGDMLVWLFDSALVERCTFSEREVWAQGRGITVRGCTFAANAEPTHTPFWGDQLDGLVMEENQFRNLRVSGTPVFLHIASTSVTPCIFRDNWIEATMSSSAGSVGGIQTALTSSLVPLSISNNEFDHTVGGADDARAIHLSCPAVIQENSFHLAENSARPAILSTYSGENILRRNLFHRTGMAFDYIAENGQADARWNWWGESSGPYHAESNPDGLGDQVRGNVLIDPWYADSMMTDAHSIGPHIATDWSLTIFPNPFNGRLTISLPEYNGGMMQVKLLDILGREVDRIFSGVVVPQKLSYTPSALLSSGVYFVRADWNGHAECQKVLFLK